MTVVEDHPGSIDLAPEFVRIFVVEDHELVAEGLEAALRLNGYDVVLSACANAAGILDEARAARPTLVLLDLDLDWAGRGQDLIGPLIEFGAPILVLTGARDRVDLARCLEAGAVGVVSKAESFASVMGKIVEAANGRQVMADKERAQYIDDLQADRSNDKARTALFDHLTPRERHVLGMIVAGARPRTIAQESFVSMPTVRSQIRSILQKLDVNSQIAAAALARRAGWRDDSA